MSNRRKMRLTTLFLAGFLLGAVTVFGQPVGISGTLEWDKMEIGALISLDLVSANIKLPSGRTMGETLISSEYLKLISPVLLGIRYDSSSTLADLVERGEMSIHDIEEIAHNARRTSPFLSPDLLSLSESCTIDIENISSALISHRRPADVRRTLSPVPAPVYTGIIIIADMPLPVHGMKSPALAQPCLFPKIWDTGMNLIYERNMLERDIKSMVRYASSSSIFYEGPSGLSPETTALVGSKPLRIIARGLFGMSPTDLIIDADDALAIISSQENRRLLSEGKVLVILEDSQIKIPLSDK